MLTATEASAPPIGSTTRAYPVGVGGTLLSIVYGPKTSALTKRAQKNSNIKKKVRFIVAFF